MFNWMIMPLKRYADFKGRSRRKEYWSFALLQVIIAVVVLGLKFSDGDSMAQMAAADQTDPLAVYRILFSGVGMILALWWAATLIPNIAVTVRRLHDRDMSGWWYLGFFIAGLIPLLNIVSGLALLVLMLLEGTRGTNRFGPDPKDASGGANVFA